MTGDIAFYVALAGAANGPLVELAVGNGRVAIPVAQATGGGDRNRLLARNARSGACARPRGWRRARSAPRRHARSLGRRARGAHLLSVPRALAPAHMERSTPYVRARRRVAASRWPLRLERVRVRSPLRRAGGPQAPGQSAAAWVRCNVGENRVDFTLDAGGTSSLWWATKNEWLGLIDVAGLELEALYGGFERALRRQQPRVRLRHAASVTSSEPTPSIPLCNAFRPAVSPIAAPSATSCQWRTERRSRTREATYGVSRNHY